MAAAAAVAAAVAGAQLPPGWRALSHDAGDGAGPRTYFQHAVTGEATWHLPPAAQPAAGSSAVMMDSARAFHAAAAPVTAPRGAGGTAAGGAASAAAGGGGAPPQRPRGWSRHVDPAHNAPFWCLQDEHGRAVAGSETWERPLDAAEDGAGSV